MLAWQSLRIVCIDVCMHDDEDDFDSRVRAKRVGITVMASACHDGTR